MKQLCDNRITCPDGIFPLANFSSEIPDRHIFHGRYDTGPDGPPWAPVVIGGETVIVGGCTQFSTGLLHQEDADGCAQRQAALCANNGAYNDPCEVCRPQDGTDTFGFFGISQDQVGANPCCNPAFPKDCCCDTDPADPDPPPPPGPQPPKMYANSAQTCTIYCPDGKPFSFTVGAGRYVAQSQDQANAMAYSAACIGAQKNRICIEDIDDTICSGEETNLEMVGSVRNGDGHYSIVAGSPPPGMTMSDDGVLSGTPSGNATSSFVVKLCDDAGNCATANVRLSVLGIVTDSPLPNATNGSAYNAAVVASGGAGGYSYGWNGGGTVPEGLTVNSDGTITGTPTGGGQYDFGIFVQDSEGVKCSKSFHMTVLAISSSAVNLHFECPCNPSITYDAVIPSGKYNLPPGTTSGQNLVDARAYADAYNAAMQYCASILGGCTSSYTLSSATANNLATGTQSNTCFYKLRAYGFDTIGQTGSPTHGTYPGFSPFALSPFANRSMQSLWEAVSGFPYPYGLGWAIRCDFSADPDDVPPSACGAGSIWFVVS